MSIKLAKKLSDLANAKSDVTVPGEAPLAKTNQEKKSGHHRFVVGTRCPLYLKIAAQALETMPKEGMESRAAVRMLLEDILSAANDDSWHEEGSNGN